MTNDKNNRYRRNSNNRIKLDKSSRRRNLKLYDHRDISKFLSLLLTLQLEGLKENGTDAQITDYVSKISGRRVRRPQAKRSKSLLNLDDKTKNIEQPAGSK